MIHLQSAKNVMCELQVDYDIITPSYVIPTPLNIQLKKEN